MTSAAHTTGLGRLAHLHMVRQLGYLGRLRHGGRVMCGHRSLPMTPQTARQIAALANQLTETLMTAALCAQEIRTIARTLVEDNGSVHTNHCELRPTRGGSNHRQRPLLDESTMCVVWKGETVHLGHTLAFRLLGRLARRPNQYVTHLDLLEDVWDGEERETTTIRSLVRELRRSLRDGGMAELAAAIRGHNGRYILEL